MFYPYKGGIETYSQELTKRLAETDSVEIITYSHAKRTPQTYIHEVKSNDKNRMLNFLNYFFGSIRISLGLDFDVIHAANVPEALSGILIKFLKRKPLVTSVHDTGFVRVNPQWSGFGASMRKYMRKIVCNVSDEIIVPTDKIKDQIVKYLGVNPRNFHVIHYGVDKGMFNLKIKGVMRERLKIASGTFVIFYSGMLYPKKGLEYAIEALKYVKERTDNFVFVIDGVEIFPGYLEKLKAVRDRLELTDKVLFPGLAEEREKWFTDCDVFVLPSVDTEGLSLTCLEAGGCGKPVITTTILEEAGAAIRDQTALIVQPRDPKAISEAILRLMEDKPLRQRLGKGNYNYSQTFDWKNTKEETESVYRKAIGVSHEA